MPPETPKKRPIFHIAFMIFLGILGGILGAFLAISLRSSAFDTGPSGAEIITILLVFPIYFFAIAVHELGHLMGGWSMGFRFFAVQVAPFRIFRTPSRLKLETNWMMTFMGGQAICYPVEISNLRSRAFWYFAGGPLMSLASGALAFGVLLFRQGTSVSFTTIELIDVLLFLFASMSILIGLFTLIPTRMMGMPSDGARIFPLILRKQIASRDLALFALFGMSHQGLRPRDWRPEWIEDALSVQENNLFGAVAYGSAHDYEMDRENYQLARDYLQQALEAIDSHNMTYRPILLASAVLFEAEVRRDLEAALYWHEQIPGQAVIPPALRYMALAAMQALQQDRAGVTESLAAARKELEESLDEGAKLASLDQMRRIEDSLEPANL